MPDQVFDRLVLASGNANKVRELTELLGPLAVPLVSLAEFPDVQPIAENGETLVENARRKAIGYARQLEHWVLADDTGLEVDALSGAPGVHSARFAGKHASMTANRAKLLAVMENIPVERRTARFVCQLALADPGGNVVAEATGICEGRIRFQPAGEFGFGYDSLFEVVDLGRTLAELDSATTARVGHRGKAVWQIVECIVELARVQQQTSRDVRG
jgi:XTP/dITP diphosphohydrolase